MKLVLILIVLAGAAALAAGCGGVSAQPERDAGGDDASLATATFAGGCFWCMEKPFEKLDGVRSVVSGYTGGEEKDPTYQEVSSGKTGHAEAVRIRFDPKKIGYAELLRVYWRQIDPTDGGGQFADRGSQYRPAIFHHDEVQRRLAVLSKERLRRSGKFGDGIAVKIVPAGPFHPAEDYHQDYYRKNPGNYGSYRVGSGRAGYLKKHWKEGTMEEERYEKPSKEDLKERLTPLQLRVTQEEGTEPPFRNEYNDNKKPGLYVDVVSGEPLFLSIDKFDSGSGWPSFTRPVEPRRVVEKTDHKLGYARTEVRSRDGDSHLGHVFDDGPAPTGLRYCINSAALRFVPKEKLEEEGYGEYLALFEEGKKE